MTCPTCTSGNIGEIAFAFESGLRFHYCRRCEHRWWEGRASNMRLDEVLRAACTLARAS